MRKLAVVVLLLVLAISVSGCLDTSTETPETSDSGENSVDENQTDSERPDEYEPSNVDEPGDESTSDSSLETTEDSTDSESTSVTVSEVVDGDTVDIHYSNGSADTVRLLGVDTPEVHTSVSPGEFEGVPDNSAGRECLSKWGDRASSFARDELLDRSVDLEFDENEGRRGYYDRLLAYIYADGEHFNYELVEQGYARVYDDSDFRMQEEFYNAESAAQNSNRGLWECTEVSSNIDDSFGGTTSSSEIGVAQIHEDAAGDEYDNLNDEYVIFENTGSSMLDLSGWTVSDEADHTYYFPDGFTLGAGETVTLGTGSGTGTSSDLYWGEGAPVWSNGGDTVVVQDESGSTVLSQSYR